MSSSTIAALATAPSPAGIAVIRVSGPDVTTILKKVFKSKTKPSDHPRRMIFGKIIDPKTKEVLDRGLVVFMPAETSFTGEDVAEFHIHGSILIAQKLLAILYRAGADPAQAGEFTKRAFLNGKVDLVQAEAISDVITATSEHALKIAEEHLAGHFSQVVESIGEPLRDALAELEAAIDFPEEDIQPDKISSIAMVLKQTQEKITALLSTFLYGSKVRDGYRVLLCGQPNVGKSSILNLLLGRERAIVSDVSGTTRDLIEEEASIDGYRFVFCDSAGLTDTNDKVEKIGVELARSRLPWADLVLFVVDAAGTDDSWKTTLQEISPQAKNIWLVVNKVDLNQSAIGDARFESTYDRRTLYLSTKIDEMLSPLREALIEEVIASGRSIGEANQVVTNERHKLCLLRASEALGRAEKAIEAHLPPEIVSAELRLALTALEEIVGKTYTEDILGRIFSKFCIGK